MAPPVSTRRSAYLADIGRSAFPPERVSDLRRKTHFDKRFLPGQSIPSRRRCPRVENCEGVWVYWNREGRADTSRVRDLSTGGLFVETAELLGVGTAIRLDFLVQEGQIRAKAVVRHVKPGSGLGLKFTALTEEDGPRLTTLMTRLHSLSRSRTNSK
jgi:hypothetical protein